MPQVILSAGAANDMNRLRGFLQSKNPQAAARAAQSIIKMIQRLEQHPQLGRPVEGMHGKIREVLIPFGRSGYLARYLYEGAAVEIIAVRHMKEAGFQMQD